MSAAPAPRWSLAALGNALALLALAAIAILLLRWQAGEWAQLAPRSGRWLPALGVAAAYAGFVAWVLWQSRPRDAREGTDTDSGSAILVAYASQTGFARQLAERSAQSLRDTGTPVRLLSIDRIDAATLAGCERALFVASTTGEGDPPDHALAFVRQVMARPAALATLRYAVLALGDREYRHFCGFGHQLDDWLRRHGAQPLFDIVEVDNAEQSALRHWQHHLGLLGGVTDLPDWSPPQYQSWILRQRRELNPGSAGGGVYHLSLQAPAGTTAEWQAGDIAEIGPRHSSQAVQDWLLASGLNGEARVGDEAFSALLSRSQLPEPVPGLDPHALATQLQPLPHREYSIASLPADGSLQVILRRMLKPDGSPGLGSGWLCDHARIGGEIALRIRANPNFHPPSAERPMLLIGNGTGIAGLRAQLKARIAAGARRNWLLFGERNRERDFFFGDEILDWKTQGFIERLDTAFSRDQPARLYVQHELRAAAAELREWFVAGAAIYVCGSLAGMAPAVDAVLRETLGDDAVEAMLADGRYRRDVY